MILTAIYLGSTPAKSKNRQSFDAEELEPARTASED